MSETKKPTDFIVGCKYQNKHNNKIVTVVSKEISDYGNPVWTAKKDNDENAFSIILMRSDRQHWKRITAEAWPMGRDVDIERYQKFTWNGERAVRIVVVIDGVTYTGNLTQYNGYAEMTGAGWVKNDNTLSTASSIRVQYEYPDYESYVNSFYRGDEEE